MGNHVGRTRHGRSERFRTIASVVVLAVTLFVSIRATLRAQSAKGQAQAAQPQTPQWQVDAGGKKAFDVTSVKPNTTESSRTNVNSNVSMGRGDYYSPTGGLFSATNFPLADYIAFAYKLSSNQNRIRQEHAPKWVFSERFDIQARVDGNPTKDQMRLMMQALLEDRFKLAMHRETRQLPVYALVVDKDGKLGPGLQPHSDDAPCSTDPQSMPAPRAAVPTTVLACGGIQAMPGSVPGRLALGARKVTMELIVDSMGYVDRQVIDKTGLSGTFDLHFEFSPQFDGPAPPNFTPDPNGLTFVEALKEQLGVKLEPQKAPVEVVVLDHVEEPSVN